MTRASIAIFPKKIEYSDERPRPEIPPKVFEVVQTIIRNKNGCELVRTKSGLYIIAYSETGPGNDPAGWEGWLPVYVAKISQWASGGIRQEEMNEFLEEKENEE